MDSEYIEQRHGGYYVAGTRISLDSVLYAFSRGDSPERILEQANPVLWAKFQRAKSSAGDSPLSISPRPLIPN